jgi:uncharacterized protein (DUF305 family)
LVLLGLLSGLALAPRLDGQGGAEQIAQDRAGAPSIDVGFAQHMGRHHDQALMLSRIFLQGHDSPLQALATRIIEDQLFELGQLRGWLRLWQAPLLPESQSMNWMLLGSQPPGPELQAYLLDCSRSPGGMPGLATSEQIQQLQQAQGPQRDRLFLQLMLAHHAGGLPMLEFASREARHPAVRQLAERMLLQQSREVLQMQQHLPTLAER